MLAGAYLKLSHFSCTSSWTDPASRQANMATVQQIKCWRARHEVNGGVFLNRQCEMDNQQIFNQLFHAIEALFPASH
jgi:hypothetical protein